MQPANEGNTPFSDETLKQLYKLNEIDLEVARARRSLEKKPKEVAAKKRQVELQEKAVQLAKDTVTAAQKQIDKKTLEIDSLAQDVLKLEGQLFSLKSNDEFNAMKSQIASRKKLDDDLQTEVLELYEAVDSLKADYEATVEKLNQLKDIATHSETKSNEEQAEQAAVVAKMEESRGACLAALPEEVLNDYQRAFERRGQGTALVIGQICKGCDTQITLQALTQVIAKKLLCCRNCQRILILGEE